MTIPDYLLIGIKDGKLTVLAQAGEPNIHSIAKAIQMKKEESGELPYDKFIIVCGAILNI
jgi:hypothetical protein